MHIVYSLELATTAFNDKNTQIQKEEIRSGRKHEKVVNIQTPFLYKRRIFTVIDSILPVELCDDTQYLRISVSAYIVYTVDIYSSLVMPISYPSTINFYKTRTRIEANRSIIFSISFCTPCSQPSFDKCIPQNSESKVGNGVTGSEYASRFY